MSITTIPGALGRIEQTDPSSPVAVFRPKAAFGETVNVMFAKTLETQKRILAGDINYIGTYHRDNIHEARQALRQFRDSVRAVA